MTRCPRCANPVPTGKSCASCRSTRTAPALALLGLLAACNGGEETGVVALYGVEIVDDDNDGYDAGVDCNDSDANVYPCAPDADGDQVDSDCDGLDSPDPSCPQ